MSDHRIRIAFLGYGTKALDALMADERFDVKYFFAPEKRLCADVYEAQARYADRVSLQVVRNNDALKEKLSECSDIDCVLINACNIIIREDVLALVPFFNIHPGSLHNNRGHQPHLWTVLLGESESEIVLHQVTPGIDEGGIVARYPMPIPADWNAGQVLDGLEAHIPELLTGLYHFMLGESGILEKVYGGQYRHIMTPEDYRIDFDAIGDTAAFEKDMDRKIRCRSMHHGAFFLSEGERIYVDRLEEKTPLSEAGPDTVTFCGLDQVLVTTHQNRYLFHINKRQKEE